MNGTIDQQYNQYEQQESSPVRSRFAVVAQGAANLNLVASRHEDILSARESFEPTYHAGPAVSDLAPQPLVAETPVPARVITAPFQPNAVESNPTPTISISEDGQMTQAPDAEQAEVINEQLLMELEALRNIEELHNIQPQGVDFNALN